MDDQVATPVSTETSVTVNLSQLTQIFSMWNMAAYADRENIPPIEEWDPAEQAAEFVKYASQFDGAVRKG